MNERKDTDNSRLSPPQDIDEAVTKNYNIQPPILKRCGDGKDIKNNEQILKPKMDNMNNNESTATTITTCDSIHRNIIDNQQQQQQHTSFLTNQYEMVEKYLQNWFAAVSKRWCDKLNQIKEIFQKYSSPMIDFDLSETLTEDDLEPTQSALGNLLLNTYSADYIRLSLEKYGIIARLAERGHLNLNIVIDTNDPFVHRMQISDQKYPLSHNITQNTHDILLLDMFVRRRDIYISEILSQKHRRYSPDNISTSNNTNNNNDINPYINSKYLPQYNIQNSLYSWRDQKDSDHVIRLIDGKSPIKATVIEWLCLQDPDKQFSEERPPLPGQQHPGLGIGKQMNQLIIDRAKEQARDCLCNQPFRFYNAFMYQSQEYFFIDPSVQGLFQSLLNDMEPYIKDYGLAPVSWAFEFGCVKEKSSGAVVKWEFHQQYRPISSRMNIYFQSKEYHSSVQENLRPLNTFYIDWEGHRSLSHFHKPKPIEDLTN